MKNNFFEFGGITMFHGDCLNMGSTLKDYSYDLIIIDLPYGTTQCKWDSVIPLESVWGLINSLRGERTPTLAFAQTPFDKVLGSSNLKHLRYEWIWEKTHATGHLNAKKMPMKAHENILVFYEKPTKYFPQMTEGHTPSNTFTKRVSVANNTEVYGKTYKEVSGGGSTQRYPRSVLKYASDKQKKEDKFHPTQKPLDLVEYLVKTYTQEGDTVLDFCMGGGTTAVACFNTGRKFVGVEKERKYFDASIERLRRRGVGEK